LTPGSSGESGPPHRERNSASGRRKLKLSERSRHPVRLWAKQVFPATLTVAAVLGVLLAAYLFTKSAKGKGEKGYTFLHTSGWEVWRGVAAVSVALWVGLLLQGIRVFRELGGDEDLTNQRRWQAVIALMPVGIGFMLTIGSILLSLQGKRTTIGVPIEEWSHFTITLLAIGGLAALPWLMTVWLVHMAVINLSRRVDEFRNPSEAIDEVWNERKLVDKYASLWDRMQGTILALAAIVTPAVLTTGALRLAVVPTYVKKEDFPANFILFYGAFFAVFVAGAVVPMVGSWRSTGHKLIDALRPLPEDGLLTEDLIMERTRLETYLHLDVGILRSPITLLSVLAPFATAVLTALATPK
jgi:hypothetical protein